MSSFSENVTGARPVLVGISNGTRPGAVTCKVGLYRAGICRVPAGPLRGPGMQGIGQDNSSLVTWLTQSPGVPISSPAAADIFPWRTYMQ